MKPLPSPVVGPPEPTVADRLAFGRWLMGALAAASFACILTLVALQREDAAAARALLAFAAALPVFCAFVIVAAEPGQPYHTSRLMRLAGLGAILLFLTGLASLLATVSPGAAAVLVLMSFGMAVTLESAQRRAKRRRLKLTASMQRANAA